MDIVTSATRYRGRAGAREHDSTDRAGTTVAGPDRASRTMITSPPRPYAAEFLGGPCRPVPALLRRPRRQLERPPSPSARRFWALGRRADSVDLDALAARARRGRSRAVDVPGATDRRAAMRSTDRLGRRGGRPLAGRRSRWPRSPSGCAVAAIPSAGSVFVDRSPHGNARLVRGRRVRQSDAGRPASAAPDRHDRAPAARRGSSRPGRPSGPRGSTISSLGRVLEHDLAGLQDVAALGDAERHQRVLLDQQHGRAAALMSLMMSKICSTRIGARPIDGSSSSSSFGPGHQRPPDRQHLLLAAGQRAAVLA